MTTSRVKWIVTGEDQLDGLAEWLVDLLRPGGVLFLKGPLGAGKTTLAKAIGRVLGVQEEMTSPTFDLVHVHRLPALTIYHLDGYRLDQPEEWEVLDLPPADEPHVVILGEWADGLRDWYPERLEVELAGVANHPSWRQAWVSAWGTRYPPARLARGGHTDGV